MSELLQEGKRLQQEYQRRLERPKHSSQDYEAKQAQIIKSRQGIARLIDSYTEGFIDKQELSRELNDCASV